MTHSCAPTRPHRLRPEYNPTPVRQPARPSHAEIARLAYSYWDARGRHGGSHLEDWFRAERELHDRLNRR
jgi:hypothetical protein